VQYRPPIAIVLFAGILTCALPVSGQSPQEIPEPQLTSEELKRGTFGDERNVALLAALLQDEDPLTRALAVTDLGQTHNPAAIPYLKRAFKSEIPEVRMAAVSAAAEIGFDEAHGVILAAISPKEPPAMIFTGMTFARKLHLSEAVDAIRSITAHGDAPTRAMAIKTLGRLGATLDPGALKPLLTDPSIPVRLAGLEHALLLEKADGIIEELLAAAGEENPPAVRSRAFEALGKHAISRARRILARCEADPDPMIRRGVVRAYHNAALGDKIPPFLDDPSEMVRLAAIQAAGDLKLARTYEKLMHLIMDAPDVQSHLAGRRSLVQIATEEVVNSAAEALVKWAETSPPPPPKPLTRPATQESARRSPPPAPQSRGPTQRQIDRNVASCCWILGKLKSSKALEYQLAMIPKLSTESSVLLELVPALGQIGDRSAIEPLTVLLGRCKEKGLKYLRALSYGYPPPPWEPQIPRRIIQALGELKAYDKVDDILGIANVNVKGLRLALCASYAVQILPELIRDDNRQKIQTFIVNVISDEGFMLAARFHAAKTAARMRINSAVPALQKILNEERPGWKMMRAAAWAIQTLTGETPSIPNPKTNQGRDWIITRISQP